MGRRDRIRVGNVLAGLLAGGAIASVSIGAHAACPSYPIGLCTTTRFCASADTLASADGSIDNPARDLVQDTVPVAVDQTAMAGTQDLFAAAEVGADTGFGVLIHAGAVSAATPGGEAPGSSAATTALGVARATDLVISGPSAFVQATLRIVLDADFIAVASGVDDEEALSSVRLDLNGAICNSQVEQLAFVGARSFQDFDPPVGLSTRGYMTSFGMLAGVPLDAVTEFSLGPFVVPTGEPLQFELRIAQSLTAVATGGSASTSAGFEVRLGDLSGGPVFELPSGYRADSAMLGIVDSYLPEPGPIPAGAAAIATLAWWRRGRGRAAWNAE